MILLGFSSMEFSLGKLRDTKISDIMQRADQEEKREISVKSKWFCMKKMRNNFGVMLEQGKPHQGSALLSVKYWFRNKQTMRH